ncbi:MAG: transcription termination factor NusA [Mariprofundales bacterium]
MDAQILGIADAVARERGVPRDIVVEAMEQAIKTAARRTYGDKILEVRIDRQTGKMTMSHLQTVVGNIEDVVDAENEIVIDDAADKKVGDVLRTALPPLPLGRVAAQTARQVINQKLREAELKRVIKEYEPRIGEVITGIVKRKEHRNIYLDLGRTEGVLYPDDCIPRENLRVGDRVRAHITRVRADNKHALVVLSRTHKGFLQHLFEQEVPEVFSKIIEIKAIARDPGQRAKIAVTSNDPSIDAVGACVGVRGARVQQITNELHGERIDVIEWSADPAVMIMNALSPANIDRVLLDEEKQTIEVAVDESDMSKAIGRQGQNVRLASELTGWTLEIISGSEASERREQEVEESLVMFQRILDIDDDLAIMLVEEGFFSLEDLAYCETSELVEIEGMDEELASELQGRARDALLEQAFAEERDEDKSESAPDADSSTATAATAIDASSDVLIDSNIENKADNADLTVAESENIATASVHALLDVVQTEECCNALETLGIHSLDDLADAGLDDLADLSNTSVAQTKQTLEQWILQARQLCGWFDAA